MATSNAFSVLSLASDEGGDAEDFPMGPKLSSKARKKKKKKQNAENDSTQALASHFHGLNIVSGDGPSATTPKLQRSSSQNLSRPKRTVPLLEFMRQNSSSCIQQQQDFEAVADRTQNSSCLKWPLVWIDLEMTGLNLDKDRILEIACIITDGQLLQAIEVGPDLIISQPEESLASMGEWCQHHHSASGLVEGVRQSKVTERQAEQEVLNFVHQHIELGTIQPSLAGNSVYMDLMFLRKYMPELASLFSHVLVDVSTIRALCLRWFPKERAPAKKNKHRALEDIKESIAELKYMQKTIFKEKKMR